MKTFITTLMIVITLFVSTTSYSYTTADKVLVCQAVSEAADLAMELRCRGYSQEQAYELALENMIRLANKRGTSVKTKGLAVRILKLGVETAYGIKHKVCSGDVFKNIVFDACVSPGEAI